jgi:hypothetical protein
VALGVCTVPPNATDEGIAQCGGSEPGRLPKLATASPILDRRPDLVLDQDVIAIPLRSGSGGCWSGKRGGTIGSTTSKRKEHDPMETFQWLERFLAALRNLCRAGVEVLTLWHERPIALQRAF